MTETVTLPDRTSQLTVSISTGAASKSKSQTVLVPFHVIKPFLSNRPLQRPKRVRLRSPRDA
jgi:hypothetical protein